MALSGPVIYVYLTYYSLFGDLLLYLYYIEKREAVKPSEALELHRPEIRRIVAAHGASNPRVFGSVARGTDTENSDIDFLVDPVKEFSLFDIGGLVADLEKVLGVSVDVAFPAELRDHIFFKVIVEARPV
jgi:uncharacterized protein